MRFKQNLIWISPSDYKESGVTDWVVIVEFHKKKIAGTTPASYVITASDLHPVIRRNSMHKSAYVTVVALLAVTIQSSSA